MSSDPIIDQIIDNTINGRHQIATTYEVYKAVKLDQARRVVEAAEKAVIARAEWAARPALPQTCPICRQHKDVGHMQECEYYILDAARARLAAVENG